MERSKICELFLEDAMHVSKSDLAVKNRVYNFSFRLKSPSP